ncbi:c-type cytochrome [Oxalicibacterium solurbis]|uniref:Cytochrome c n=1 Tax=Oxalicibacterium solurbis TaxID=69280 RepID=A0A8J3F7Q2_9BURK|nr:cytochrome c family protein [Oxalicibacterium solurbis]GGI55621.1 cytochrome c [Oxalicibacterium solurbis]
MAKKAAANNVVAGDAKKGRNAFAKCASCHEVGRSAHGGFGPQLNGIVGRRAGSTSDFRYSPAMKQAGFIWTEDRLRAFLKAPDDVVPGNKMRFWGLRSDREIDDLLAYLRTFPQQPPSRNLGKP